MRVSAVSTVRASHKSDVHPGILDGQLSVSISVPVMRGDRVLRILNAHVGPQQLSQQLALHAGHSGTVASLLDGHRSFVARSHDSQQQVGTTPGGETVAMLSTGATGVTRLGDSDGNGLRWSWTTTPWGWMVFLGTPTSMMEAPLRTSVVRLTNREKDEFLAMLSHELRNPLALIANAHRLIARAAAERDQPIAVSISEAAGRIEADRQQKRSGAGLARRAQNRHPDTFGQDP